MSARCFHVLKQSLTTGGQSSLTEGISTVWKCCFNRGRQRWEKLAPPLLQFRGAEDVWHQRESRATSLMFPRIKSPIQPPTHPMALPAEGYTAVYPGRLPIYRTDSHSHLNSYLEFPVCLSCMCCKGKPPKTFQSTQRLWLASEFEHEI